MKLRIMSFLRDYFDTSLKKIELEPIPEYKDFSTVTPKKKSFSKPTPWWFHVGFLLFVLMCVPLIDWKKPPSFSKIFGVTSPATKNVALVPTPDVQVIELQPGQALVYVVPDPKNPTGKPSFVTEDREPIKKPSQKFFYVPAENNEWKVLWIFKEK